MKNFQHLLVHEKSSAYSNLSPGSILQASQGNPSLDTIFPFVCCSLCLWSCLCVSIFCFFFFLFLFNIFFSCSDLQLFRVQGYYWIQKIPKKPKSSWTIFFCDGKNLNLRQRIMPFHGNYSSYRSSVSRWFNFRIDKF